MDWIYVSGVFPFMFTVDIPAMPRQTCLLTHCKPRAVIALAYCRSRLVRNRV